MATAAVLALGACTGSGSSSPDSSTSAATTSAAPTLVVGGGGTTELQLVRQMYVLLLRHAGYTVRSAATSDRAAFLPAIASGATTVAPDYAAPLADHLFAAAGPTPSATSSATPSAASATTGAPTPADASSSSAASPSASASPPSSAQASAQASAAAAAQLRATLAAARPLARADGLQLLTPTQASNTNAFVVRKAFAKQYSLTTVSQLAALGLPLTLAADPTCPGSPTCQAVLTQDYGATISTFVGVQVPSPTPSTSSPASTSPSPSTSGPATPPPPATQEDAVGQDLQAGVADVGVVPTTDASLSQYGLVALDDDLRTQPPGNIVPVVGAAAAPGVTRALQSLSPVLTTADLTQMDGQVEGQHLTVEQVAESYLKDKNLI